jgi:hypothetical protein
MFKTRLLHSGWHLSANVDTFHSGFPVTYLVANAWQLSIDGPGILKRVSPALEIGIECEVVG